MIKQQLRLVRTNHSFGILVFVIMILIIIHGISSISSFKPSYLVVTGAGIQPFETSGDESIADYIDQIQIDRKDISYGLSDNEILVQSFTPMVNMLTRVSFYGWQKEPAPGELNISICKSFNGPPISTMFVDSSLVPLNRNNADWFEVDIPDISVEPNTTYYIVWKPCFDYDGASYYWWFDYYRSISRPDDDAYPRGMQYRSDTAYPLNDFCFKTYGYSVPTLQINSPLKDEIVYGKKVISGTADDKDGTITKVEIAIDTDNWVMVNGTEVWEYEWDTFEESNGLHRIYVRSFDGQSYSTKEIINVSVSNTKMKIKWISGGVKRLSVEFENDGNMNAYNVTCSLDILQLFTKEILFQSLDFYAVLNPGELEIIAHDIEKNVAIVTVTVTINADNAESVNWVTYGVIFGKHIFII